MQVLPLNFRAEGNITIMFHTEDGKIEHTDSYPFAFELSNDVSQVTAIQPNGWPSLTAIQKNNLSAVIASRQSPRYYPKSAFTNLFPGGNSNVVPLLSLAIHATPFPVATYFEQIPWIAFSGGHVMRTNLFIPAPWENAEMSPMAHVTRFRQSG
jgi:hypothetical protein